MIERAEGVFQLRHRPRADQRRGDPSVAQRPGDGHLGKALPTALRQGVERPDVVEVFFAQMTLPQGALLPVDPGVGRDPVQVAVGQQALCQGRKADAAHAQLVQHVQQALGFDPAIEHGIGGLVDQQRHALGLQQGVGLAGQFR